VTLHGIIAALLIVAAAPLQTPDAADRARSMNDDLHRLQGISPGNPEPPLSTVSAGDIAPDFSFESMDHHWLRLHDLLAQGNVLLVFGAEEAQLTAIEREQGAMLSRGIVPVAVLDRRDGATWATVRRLGLHYSVLSDPQCVIGAQFNVLHPTTHGPVPSWFVIDRKGCVRGLKRATLPSSGFGALAASALGMPSADVTVPTGVR
jgi:peroxiredoxin